MVRDKKFNPNNKERLGQCLDIFDQHFFLKEISRTWTFLFSSLQKKEINPSPLPDAREQQQSRTQGRERRVTKKQHKKTTHDESDAIRFCAVLVHRRCGVGFDQH